MSDTPRHDEAWKDAALVRRFLNGIRGGIPFGEAQLEMMLRVIEARDQDVQRVLDLGCGSGVLARAILARYPGARATLVDFSEPMLAQARANLAQHSPVPRIVLADLATPAWADGMTTADAPFDAIVSGYAIHHLTDVRKQALYGEIFRLLAANGIFINVEHVASQSAWVESISDGLIIDSLYGFHRAQGQERTREQVADEYVHRPDKAANILAPVEQQCEWLRTIGFVDVDCYFKAFELAVFGGRRPETQSP